MYASEFLRDDVKDVRGKTQMWPDSKGALTASILLLSPWSNLVNDWQVATTLQTDVVDLSLIYFLMNPAY